VLGLARGFQERAFLLSGAELDLFHIARANSDDGSGRCRLAVGADLHALTILLDALAALSTARKRDGRRTKLSRPRRCLARDRPGLCPPQWHCTAPTCGDLECAPETTHANMRMATG